MIRVNFPGSVRSFRFGFPPVLSSVDCEVFVAVFSFHCPDSPRCGRGKVLQATLSEECESHGDSYDPACFDGLFVFG